MSRTFSQPTPPSRSREGFKLLRGYIVLRTPTAEELASRPPLVLTERDRALLTAVHLHGFLSVDLLALACFPPSPQGRHTPCSAAYDRLRLLWLWRYLDRLQFPAPRGGGGSRRSRRRT